MKHFDYLGLNAAILQTLITVYETGHVSNAAEQMDISQSTLSHRLKKARLAIRDPLFVQAGRNITPTPRLIEIIPLAYKILEDLQLILEPSNPPYSELTGNFSIAASDYERSVFLFRAYKTMHQIAPKIKVDFTWHDGDSINDLRAGTLDLLISVFEVQDSLDIHQKTLFSDEVVCFYDAACREAPKSLEDFLSANHIRVLFSKFDSSIVDQSLAKTGHSRNIVLTLPSISEVPQMLLGSTLVAALPAKLEHSILKGFSTAPSPVQIERLNFNLLWHKKTHVSRKHKWLREQIVKQAALFF